MKSLFCAVKGWPMNNETPCHEGIWWSGSIGPYILNTGDCFTTSIHSIGGLGPRSHLDALENGIFSFP